jgi:hypothetical protein
MFQNCADNPNEFRQILLKSQLQESQTSLASKKSLVSQVPAKENVAKSETISVELAKTQEPTVNTNLESVSLETNKSDENNAQYRDLTFDDDSMPPPDYEEPDGMDEEMESDS